MSREEEIKQEAKSRYNDYRAVSFRLGAEWADTHPSEEQINKIAKIVSKWYEKRKSQSTRLDAEYIKRMLKKKPTDRMLRAVGFCEEVLNIKYEGNKEDFYAVSNFLSSYLDQAKIIMEDAMSSYYSNFDY